MSIFDDADEFIRQPFVVKGVHVTLENIHELSELLGDLVIPADEELLPYIDVNPEIIRNRSKVRIGQYVTLKEGEFQVFGAESFGNQFVATTPEIMSWVEWLAKKKGSATAD